MTTSILPVSAAALTTACAALKTGKLVGFATETVYGLGADASNADAVAAIYAAKDRPHHNPLICHLANCNQAFLHGIETPVARQLADAFWPGPMTLVLEKHPESPVCNMATAGLDSIALRVPGQASARALLQQVNLPIAAPSANRSGRISPTRASHVREELGDCDQLVLILDDGDCSCGLESTVIDVRAGQPQILRPGAITAEMINTVLNEAETTTASASTSDTEADRITRSPGMMDRHYAPTTPLIMDCQSPTPDDAWLGFGSEPIFSQTSGPRLNLSPDGDLDEAAARLFSLLRQLDKAGTRRICVAPIPHHGIGIAINDRLRRAALGSTRDN